MRWLVLRETKDDFGQVYLLALAEGDTKAGAIRNLDFFLCNNPLAKEYVHEGSIVYVERTDELWMKEYLKIYRHVCPLEEDSFSIYPQILE